MEGQVVTMPVIRTYQCNDCKETFEVTCGADDPDPDCPGCSVVMEWRPQKFSIGGSVTSKAVDLTQKVLEEDYGMTDFKDNQREGDVAFKEKPRTADERHAIEKMEADAKEYAKASQLSPGARDFWGGARGGAPANIVASVMADVKSQSTADRSAGIDKVMKLGKQGVAPQVRILAKG